MAGGVPALPVGLCYGLTALGIPLSLGLYELVRCDLFLTEKVRHRRNLSKLKGVQENRFVN